MCVIMGVRRRLRLYFTSAPYRAWCRARRRLRKVPRYTERTLEVLGYDLEILDAASFLTSFREIFVDEILRFEAGRPRPRVLDCGAHIGLTVLYVRRIHPEARITAFEADPESLRVLRRNLEANGAGDVEVVPRAVWTEQGRASFFPEGADGGRLERPVEGVPRVEVETVRLREYLTGPVDLLKIDVEGAENEILPDIADRLDAVRNLFVEYHGFVGEPQRLGELLVLLREAGFRVSLRPRMSPDRPFLDSERLLGMDLQADIFARRAGGGAR